MLELEGGMIATKFWRSWGDGIVSVFLFFMIRQKPSTLALGGSERSSLTLVFIFLALLMRHHKPLYCKKPSKSVNNIDDVVGRRIGPYFRNLMVKRCGYDGKDRLHRVLSAVRNSRINRQRSQRLMLLKSRS